MKSTSHLRISVHPLSLIMGLLVMGVAFGVQMFAVQPPSPKPETAPANEFSAARALALAARLLADGAPHPTGTQANAQVRDRIINELTGLGYEVDTQAAFSCQTRSSTCGYVENILTRLPGHAQGPAVLLSAHYDSVGAGPGAADDMAGVAVILEIARMLRDEAQLSAPIIFLLNDGEEPGLLGAEAFVRGHEWAADVGVVINLEARGTKGQSLLFETTDNNRWLIDAFLARAPKAATSSLYDELYKYLPSDTDLTVYEAAGIAGINFAFLDELAHYHTPLDNLANLDPGSVQHHGDNAWAAVRTLAEANLADPPTGNLVYLDLWPGVILQWPQPWTGWLALLCLLVWLGLTTSLIRRDALSVRSLLWGGLALPSGVLAAVLLGLGIVVTVSLVTGTQEPWYAYPLPLRVAIWAGALASITLAATWVARRAGYWGLTCGVWLWWCLLSLLLAWAIPGASIIVLSPTMLALLALVVIVLTPLHTSPGARGIAALVALFGTSSLWLPFALYAEVGAGLELGAIVGLAVALAASALAPLFATPEGESQTRRWLLMGTAVVVVAAVGLALWVPTYSALRPQRLNILHYEDRHLGQASWVIDSSALSNSSVIALPPALQQAAPFEPAAQPHFPWSHKHYPVAPATATTAPAPELRVLTDERIGENRVLQLELRSPRQATQLKLYIPEAAGLQRIEVVGRAYSMEETPVENGYHTFTCIAPACDGLILALHIKSETSFALYIVDTSPGLPPAGDHLLQARPTTAAPSQDGDVTIIANQLLIGASADE